MSARGESTGSPGRPPSIGGTLADAWSLLRAAPRVTLGPLLAVQGAVALATAAVTAMLFAVVFPDEPVVAPAAFLDARATGLRFALAVLNAAGVLFAQVARAGTIVGTAASRRKETLSLAQALDPAFTRMGGLLVLAVLVATVSFALALTLVGIALLPFVAARIGLAAEALVLEERDAFAALGRSWEVTRRRTLRTLGLLVAVALPVVPVLLVLARLRTVATDDRPAAIAFVAIAHVVEATALAPFLAYATVATTLYFLKLRTATTGR